MNALDLSQTINDVHLLDLNVLSNDVEKVVTIEQVANALLSGANGSPLVSIYDTAGLDNPTSILKTTLIRDVFLGYNIVMAPSIDTLDQRKTDLAIIYIDAETEITIQLVNIREICNNLINKLGTKVLIINNRQGLLNTTITKAIVEPYVKPKLSLINELVNDGKFTQVSFAYYPYAYKSIHEILKTLTAQWLHENPTRNIKFYHTVKTTMLGLIGESSLYNHLSFSRVIPQEEHSTYSDSVECHYINNDDLVVVVDVDNTLTCEQYRELRIAAVSNGIPIIVLTSRKVDERRANEADVVVEIATTEGGIFNAEIVKFRGSSENLQKHFTINSFSGSIVG